MGPIKRVNAFRFASVFSVSQPNSNRASYELSLSCVNARLERRLTRSLDPEVEGLMSDASVRRTWDARTVEVNDLSVGGKRRDKLYSSKFDTAA